ncbi:hypothetical protein PYW08_001802 [Mythimna loreyi]|uniref:Uncharacterized protein n=1 Tax=Mythimna loreyi TaxID=667449 RepID=A0ACC2R5J9_9NEOP|nr:hypothetical protein PYW08_001802 [Mythimna loreyi]
MMFARNLKLWICVACLASSLAAPAPAQGPQLYLDIIDMAAISRMTPQQLEALAEGLAAEEIMRTKRSSASALSSVVSKASSGLQSKVGLLGQASAFISSASSKTSGHGDEGQGYNYEPHQQDEKYDYWGLKKSILYTLFQAVKAITGGVTILKGQLIKGGGALAATLGKVISVKGDAVSNLGKKIVSSAALSHKKPHSTAVYGPPPTSHLEYGPPTAYGAPTAPAHFTAPSVPTGYAAHKYPSQLDELIVMSSVVDAVSEEPMPMPSEELLYRYFDLVSELCINEISNQEVSNQTALILGQNELEPLPQATQDVPQINNHLGRNKLNGVHAGLVILTPLGEVAPSESLDTAHSEYPGHTPLDPPPSILNTVYSAIKNAFSSTVPSLTEPAHSAAPSYAAPSYPAPSYPPTSYAEVPTAPAAPVSYQPPPPPQAFPTFKPMTWGALNSYGQPAVADYYSDYDPRVPAGNYDYAAPKRSVAPTIKTTGLTSEKIQKITNNLKKVTAYINQQQRSSESFKLADLDAYREMLVKGEVPFLPTPVVSDNELGVLPAEILDPVPTTTTTTSTTTTTTTTEKPQTSTEQNRRQDVKYYLRGNKIVQVR